MTSERLKRRDFLALVISKSISKKLLLKKEVIFSILQFYFFILLSVECYDSGLIYC